VYNTADFPDFYTEEEMEMGKAHGYEAAHENMFASVEEIHQAAEAAAAAAKASSDDKAAQAVAEEGDLDAAAYAIADEENK
jgi:hypothetical protein